MRAYDRRTLVGAGIALLAAPATASAAAQPASTGLGGIWRLRGGGGDGGEATGSFPQSQWSATTLPFTPEGKKAFDSNKPGKGPRLVAPALGNDPIGGANPPGLLRTLIYSRPFEIIQLPDKIVQVFELGRVFRIIYTDGRPVPDEVPAGPYWYGYSVGRWEGDTLVVTTLGLDERAWMDEWGTPFSPDLRTEERWRRTGPDQIGMQMTVTDPAMYTRPWTSSTMTYRRERRGVEPQEIIFAPMDEAFFNANIRDPAGLPPK